MILFALYKKEVELVPVPVSVNFGKYEFIALVLFLYVT